MCCDQINRNRLVIMFASVSLFLLTTEAQAQQNDQESAPVVDTPKKPEVAITKAPVKNDNGVIQLEAVIRGNQQQPKVLTIVPWQSPERRNALPSPVWRQVKQQLQPLERRDFLQEQRLFKKLSKY